MRCWDQEGREEVIFVGAQEGCLGEVVWDYSLRVTKEGLLWGKVL